MRKVILFIMLCSFASVVWGQTCGAAVEHGKVQVAVLGTFHFSNPGMDVVEQRNIKDVLSAQGQKEVNRLLELLESFRPTKILVEEDVKNDSLLERQYREFVAGKFQIDANEIYQVGFKLAKRLGYSKVWSVDSPIVADDYAFLRQKVEGKNVSKKVMVDNLSGMVEKPVIIAEDSTEVAMLREFYCACLSSHFRGNEQFYAKYMTEAMQEKVWRMSAEVGVNAIIRAQDVPEDSCATLGIKPLGNNWYMVSYIFGKDGPYEKKHNIPVKVVQGNGQCRIGYITPYSQELAYGDSLWYSEDTFPSVERSEPLSFVKSFYDLYTAKYSSLLSNLQQELATIRAEYLTSKAQEQFAKAEAFNREDCGAKGYDLLIGRFDFLNQWRSAIKVVPTDEKGIYCVNYYSTSIWVEVIEKEGKCFINSIYNEDSENFK